MEYENYIITVAPNDKIRDLIRCCRSFEPIVRCRDCKFYDKYDGEEWCEMFDFVTPMDISNGFCAWGSKRDAAQ